jgi:hypothetical protein
VGVALLFKYNAIIFSTEQLLNASAPAAVPGASEHYNDESHNGA